jgi:hypothetical protein
MSNPIAVARTHAPRPAEPAPDENLLAELRECFADLDNPCQRAFLAGFVAVMSVHGAARLAGVDRSCHYDWMNKDDRYRERVELARQMIADHFEAEIWRRAFQGVDTPLHWRGEITAWTKTYSDTLAVFALRALKPEAYRRSDPDFDMRGPTSITIRVHKPGEEQNAEPALPTVSIPAADAEEL